MTAPPTARLRVDPLDCEGVGLCARIADIDLDRWGYPVVGDVDPRRLAAARRAVAACPRRALWLEGEVS